jgi:hypothetical protein
MNTRIFRRLLLVGLLMAITVPVLTGFAQDGGNCPASVLLSLARANTACSETERNQACYGNGNVAPTFQGNASETTFSQIGDRVDVEWLRSLQIGGSETSVGRRLKVQGNLVDRSGHNVRCWLLVTLLSKTSSP